MRKHHIDTLLKCENLLNPVYWELMENHENREANRLDTILGKIHKLIKIDDQK